MALCSPVRRTFSDERSHGTFHSLGALPKRRKPPVFHFHDDDDAVPFPRTTSPSSSSPPSPSSPSPPASPALPRGASTPVLLSNGKPLKSSLKLSSSSPVLTPQPMHLRARSEPSTPKNVHFPEKDYGLATVRVFNCKARPAALSNPANGNGDETETEGEDTPPIRFPFAPHSPVVNYEIDPLKSSPLPPTFAPAANLLLESLNLTSSSSTSPSSKPVLSGSILVRNLAFQKHVAIRFTLDDWQTVSEVVAHYVDSLSSLPSRVSSLPSDSTSDDPASERGRGWDRFDFTIRLEDYAPSLSTRTIWLAACYRVESTYPLPGSAEHGPGGEWWDNNSGSNYRLGFRSSVVPSVSPRVKPRRETVSAPITSRRTQPQPPTTNKEHVLGLMIPTVPKPKEIRSLNETDRHTAPLRVGKLNLCNYVPPSVHATSSVSFPCTDPPSSRPSSSTTKPQSLPSTSGEDSSSPASSNLSTPSNSPTITPRVIVNGQPATYLDDDVFDTAPSRPVHIADWDWSAPGKPGMLRRRADPVPVSGTPSPSGKALSDNSLYDAFVTKWCFAQGPSLNPHCYDDSGIMA